MLSNDEAPPVDRPNLSKDYLAGNAPEEWIPLRPDSFYAENNIDLRLGANVVAINVRSREVVLGDGSQVAYDQLLLTTGAEPICLSIPGADQPHVHTLRSLADCHAIIEGAKTARRAVVLGASFIGLEVAASLRIRGIEVHVVAPDKRPMERILGPQMGDFVKALHTEHGVIFHLEDTARAITDRRVELNGGGTIEADLVVAGVGVRPRIELAEEAGLAIDRGVVVDAHLETSVPGVFAAGDIARWPDAHSGRAIRVEHWVVAERQGQTAALNMLGHRVEFTAVPFFWSQHYDVLINYVGHAEVWDEIAIDGDIAGKDCVLSYKRARRVLAVASINRDIANLEAEMRLEQKESRRCAERAAWLRAYRSADATRQINTIAAKIVERVGDISCRSRTIEDATPDIARLSRAVLLLRWNSDVESRMVRTDGARSTSSCRSRRALRRVTASANLPRIRSRQAKKNAESRPRTKPSISCSSLPAPHSLTGVAGRQSRSSADRDQQRNKDVILGEDRLHESLRQRSSKHFLPLLLRSRNL